MSWKIPLPPAHIPPPPEPEQLPQLPAPPVSPRVLDAATADLGGSRPLRLSWRDYPPEYITMLREAGDKETSRLGPMTWNDVRFAQREFYRLVATLRRNVQEGDQEAVPLDEIARRLRASCPRCEHDLTRHWFILKSNPLVKAMRGQP